MGRRRPPGPEPSLDRRLARDLLLCFVLGGALRVWAVVQARGVELVLDEVDYFQRAAFVLEQGRLPDAFRPPVYPLFIALVRLVADSVEAVRLAQAGVGALLGCVLLAWLQPLVGTRAARLAAALACLYPTFVGFPHLLLSETLCLSLFAGALALSLPAGPRPPGRAFAAGLVFGLTWLTRSSMVGALPVLLLASAAEPLRWRWRDRPALRALLFAAGVALVVLPWTAHNRVVQGRFILVEMTSGYNLWKGNTPVQHAYRTEGPIMPGPLVPVPMFAYEGSLQELDRLCAERFGVDSSGSFSAERNDCAGALAREYILADPMGFLARGPEKLLFSFHPSSILTQYLWLGWYGDVSRRAGMALIQATAWSYGLLLLLSLLGFARARWSPLKTVLTLLLLAQVAVIFTSFGNVRFRMIVELLLVVFAGLLLARPPASAVATSDDRG